MKLNKKISETDRGYFYEVYLPEYDIHFCCKVEKGRKELYRKARAMVKSLKNFLKEFPEYNK